MGSEVTGCSETVHFCCVDGCSAKFSRSNRMTWHQRVHSEERPYICSIEGCDKSYTRQYHLTRHIKDIHDKKSENSFSCTEDGCNKVLSSKNTLYKHIRSYHKKRQFKCPECCKVFLKHQHLKKHSFEHTGVLPFVCSAKDCNRRFLLPSKLKAHEKIHKGYTCTVSGCQQHFSKWSLLRKHMKVDHQKVYRCELCDRSFFTKSNLYAHLEVHNTDRDAYCCPHESCSRHYLHKKNLVDHIEKVHKKKRIKCQVESCTQTFCSKQIMQRHLKLHDPDRPLPSKKKKKHSFCRKKNIPSKSAAALLSGFEPDPVEDKKLIKVGVSVQDCLEDDATESIVEVMVPFNISACNKDCVPEEETLKENVTSSDELVV